MTDFNLDTMQFQSIGICRAQKTIGCKSSAATEPRAYWNFRKFSAINWCNLAL